MGAAIDDERDGTPVRAAVGTQQRLGPEMIPAPAANPLPTTPPPMLGQPSTVRLRGPRVLPVQIAEAR